MEDDDDEDVEHHFGDVVKAFYSFLTLLIPLTRAGEGDLVRLGVEAELDGGLDARGVSVRDDVDNLEANTDLNCPVG